MQKVLLSLALGSAAAFSPSTGSMRQQPTSLRMSIAVGEQFPAPALSKIGVSGKPAVLYFYGAAQRCIQHFWSTARKRGPTSNSHRRGRGAVDDAVSSEVGGLRQAVDDLKGEKEGGKKDAEAIKAEMTPVMVGAEGADGQVAVQALPPAKPKPKWMTPPAASTAAIAEMRREEQRRRREEEKKRRAANGGDAEGGADVLRRVEVVGAEGIEAGGGAGGDAAVSTR